jgi:hypothetical protein
VIAARHCPRCGGRVLADPPDPRDEFDEPPELTPGPEYRAAVDRYQAVLGWGVVVGCWVWPISLALGSAVLARYGTGFRWLDQVLAGWACIGLPLVAVAAGWVWGRRVRWDPRVTCRWCREPMIGHPAAVSATGNCTSCGRPAVGPPDDGPPAPAGPLFTVEEFVARVAARRRVTTRAWRLFMALLFLLLAPMAVPLLVLGHDEAETRLTRRVGEDEAARLMAAGPLLWAAGVLIASAVAAGVYYARKVRRHPLACPRCGKAFLRPGLVLASRRCDQCHEPAFAEAEFPARPDEPPGRPPGSAPC